MNTAENLIERPAAQNQNMASNKPQGLPDKFWDVERNEVIIDALIADYNNMAGRDENLIESNVRNLPASYDAYEINIPSPYLERDDDVLKKFYEKNFSNDQAQLVYDLANEKILPYIEDMTANFEAQHQIEKLVSHFGSKEKFNEISRQISTWSKQNVKPEVYDALATTCEGVIALYKMMSSNEPMLSRESGSQENLSEESLKKMMEDPKYWRDHEKSYVSKIKQGFEKLYPSK